MALDGCAAEQEVDLIVVVAETSKVLYHAQGGLAVGDGGVEVVLLAVFVDGEACVLWSLNVVRFVHIWKKKIDRR